MCHSELSFPVAGGAGIAEEHFEIPGDGVMLPSFFVRPDGDAAPAVLILHDINGANDFYHDLARRLAFEGFAALLPDYFTRQGPLPKPTREAAMARGSKLDQPTTLKDIAHSIRWLAENEITTGGIGVVGFCMGGTLALLSAGRDPLPAASVSYYGFPAGRPGWPHKPLDEVDQLQAPVLAVWGDQDHSVGMDNVGEYERAAKKSGKTVQTKIYPGLPHGFLTFDPASPNYAPAQDSWARTLAFFRGHLSP